jgi:hypothetical protein
MHSFDHISFFFLEWEMFQKKIVGKIKTHILCSVPCFSKTFLLWHNVEKYYIAWQTTEDKMTHALCMLDSKGHIKQQQQQQQRLYDRASIPCYTYTACFVQ